MAQIDTLTLDFLQVSRYEPIWGMIFIYPL